MSTALDSGKDGKAESLGQFCSPQALEPPGPVSFLLLSAYPCMLT